ncbi:phage portal protein [Mycobacterium sp. PS03-16]|uniref:phage portal protein n=1 Tax=Mycobacterium sp. PS03-16 TaxID=2559611 RepID=UPI001073AB4C|nr:phage portal protein [Mycobacterium sp. PS03-16]TFV61403.1 phage portal protein [Mycobacterium sp. PS03-16]
MARWWQRKSPAEQQRAQSWSVSDPAIAELFGLGTPNLTGQSVGEQSVLGLAAVYRAVSLIAGTIASLPMRTIVTNADGSTTRARSFLDTPGGPTGPTAFEWKESVLVHLLLHGNAYCAHIYGGAGQIVGLLPIHPSAVSVEIDERTGTRFYTVALSDGTRRLLDATQLTHIPALSTDGVVGLSPIAVARNMFGTSLAGERAAARMFSNGAMVSGIVTPEEDLTADEATTIKNDLRNRLQGTANAGDIAVINRKLKFTQWSMNAEDAQFLQSRAFQVEEIARIYGVPPHLLMQTEKQTSWGTGVSEQNRGFARYTLEPWTTRVQERLSRLLTGNRKVEFDYSAFVQPSPEIEIPLLIQQVESGLLTVNEARKIRNLPPLPGGNIASGTDTAGESDGGTQSIGSADDFGTVPDAGTLRVASDPRHPPALAAGFMTPLVLPPTTNGAHRE